MLDVHGSLRNWERSYDKLPISISHGVTVSFCRPKTTKLTQVQANERIISSVQVISLLVRNSFILGSQNVDFFGYVGRNNKSAQK